MQPWDRVLALPQGRENTIHNIIFELFHRYWNLHQVGKVNYAPHKLADPRPIGTRRLMMLISTYLTTNQSEECP